MPRHRALIPAAIAAGIILIIVAIIYWAEPAKSLPFPDFLGHQAGSNTRHIKHGVAALGIVGNPQPSRTS